MFSGLMPAPVSVTSMRKYIFASFCSLSSTPRGMTRAPPTAGATAAAAGGAAGPGPGPPSRRSSSVERRSVERRWCASIGVFMSATGDGAGATAAACSFTDWTAQRIPAITMPGKLLR